MAVESIPFYCSLMSHVNAIDSMSDLLLSRPNPALLQAFSKQRRQEQSLIRAIILEVYRKAIVKHASLVNPYDADKLVSISLPVFDDPPAVEGGLAMRRAFAKHITARMLSMHRLEDCTHLLDSFNCCTLVDSTATPTDTEWTYYELIVQAQQAYNDYAKAYGKGNAIAFEAKAAVPGASDRYHQWVDRVTRMADRFAVLAERLLELAEELPIIKDKGLFEGHEGLLRGVKQMYDEQMQLQLRLVRQQLQ